MNKVSRRSLARWAAAQLAAGQSAGAISKRLASVLIENKMAGQAGFLLDDILWELEHGGELAYAKVTSAQPLSKELEASLRAQIKKATASKAVFLKKTVDKSALGGIRIETASRTWDQTLSRKLAELREAV